MLYRPPIINCPGSRMDFSRCRTCIWRSPAFQSTVYRRIALGISLLYSKIPTRLPALGGSRGPEGCGKALRYYPGPNFCILLSIEWSYKERRFFPRFYFTASEPLRPATIRSPKHSNHASNHYFSFAPPVWSGTSRARGPHRPKLPRNLHRISKSQSRPRSRPRPPLPNHIRSSR